MNILISILGGVAAGIIIGYFLWGKREILRSAQNDNTSAQNDDDGDLIREKEAEKAANLEKLKNFIATKDQITNDEAQALLKVSAATAERYFDELEAQGLIKQVGETGQSVYYSKN